MASLLEATRSRLVRFIAPTPRPDLVVDDSYDLPLRREAADISRAAAGILAQRTQEGLMLPFGMGTLDSDDYLYRRLTGSGNQQLRRDLAPMAQDRMIEVCNFLWEANPFAKRLITLMTDLILGEGIAVEAADARNQEIIDRMWNHRVNQMASNIRRFYNAASVNGELVIPVATNPINGIPTFGFIDPYQIKEVQTLPDNVLVNDALILKPIGGVGQGQRLKIVREDPVTGKLEGEVFYWSLNALPNSVRGRSDLMVVADWLDLYDQFMFAEMERVNLLSNFVWDYKIEGANTPKEIQDKLAKFPKPTPGAVFAHNEKESLEPRTPDLKAQDRSEIARAMRVHIAGSFGYPVTYLGDVDSNRATIEGQNDIMMKTPAARQKEFAAFVDQIVRYSIEHAQGASPSLFRDIVQGYKIVMPEISAKDIGRVGTVMTSVMAAMDTALANRTMSRRAAVQIQLAVIKHLGVVLDQNEVMEEADEEAAAAQEDADARAASIAAGRGNAPIPPDDNVPPNDGGDDDLAAVQEAVERMEADLAAALAGRPSVINVTVPKQDPPNVKVDIAAPTITVEAAPAPNVSVPVTVSAATGRKVIERDGDNRISAIREE